MGALGGNTTGSDNTAVGVYRPREQHHRQAITPPTGHGYALLSNTTGYQHGQWFQALLEYTGSSNTATGSSAR